MKTMRFLPLFGLMLFLAACDRDPYALDVERFDIYWFDGDHSGTRTPVDELDFDVQINTTDPDTDSQYITEWEFSYSVNGKFVGVLQSDRNLSSNGLTFKGTVGIDKLILPFSGGLQPGDKIEFRFWAVDNHGTAVERFYLYTLE